MTKLQGIANAVLAQDDMRSIKVVKDEFGDGTLNKVSLRAGTGSNFLRIYSKDQWMQLRILVDQIFNGEEDNY